MATIRGLFVLVMASAIALGASHAALANETVTYTYDALGRLVTVQSSGDVNNGQKAQTTYDPAGNRSNQTVTGAGTAAEFSISDASGTEGGDVVLTVSRSGPTSAAASVHFESTDGTAVSGSDYTTVSDDLDFAIGETNHTVTVSTLDDNVSEASETFNITLSSAVGATISVGSAVGTIVDNEPPPALVEISDATAAEGGVLSFTVTRAGDTTVVFDVNYATANGTAVSSTDYNVASGQISFADGETTKTVSVTTLDDSTPEPAESLTISLSGATAGAVIAHATGIGTITDNDVTPTQLSISGATATEGGPLTFTVTRSGSTFEASSANWATSNGTASGSDYTAASDIVGFAVGETSKTIVISTIDDATVESPETVKVTLSNPVGATLGTAIGTGTINDNDIGLAVGDASATEGSAVTFTITRTGMTTGTTSVNYSTSNGTATAGSDYTAASAVTVSFAAGQTTKTFNIATTADTVGENNETFTVTLSSPTNGAVLLDATAIGTINNDDVSFAISDATVTEGGTLTFTVTKVGQHSGTRTVNYSTSNGTATSGSDYTAKINQQLSFSSGTTSLPITVITLDDSTTEIQETLTVTLSAPSGGATLTDATGTGYITDNDAATQIQLTDALYNVLPAHQSFYGCEYVSFPEYGIGYANCWLTSNNIYVFQASQGSGTYDTGYSYSNGIRVLSNYYGTGQAP